MLLFAMSVTVSCLMLPVSQTLLRLCPGTPPNPGTPFPGSRQEALVTTTPAEVTEGLLSTGLEADVACLLLFSLGTKSYTSVQLFISVQAQASPLSRVSAKAFCSLRKRGTPSPGWLPEPASSSLSVTHPVPYSEGGLCRLCP